ncbi:hypothetical protein HUB98_04060 [Paenibacillus barcinonensis]|uniref:Uncharacterized protein n=1 Tax=Paenibacillus barcinonensis TaxID=198119 RepID=A0A2V4VJR2_PAEBA|nr:hypothetical protein [Paenibacillus barcinonensis]PYE49364.1 hypothetical protein DFQ00_106350 [Paenibacillus barcinonensis]QKS55572.1 hypothetical protein HUB98_04060 [Paenibacillus barcinonensis]
MKELSTKLHLINKDNQKHGEIIGEEILSVVSPLINTREEIDIKKLVEDYLIILSELPNLSKSILCMKIFDDDFLQDLEYEVLKRTEFPQINHETTNEFNNLIEFCLEGAITSQSKPYTNHHKHKFQQTLVRKIYDKFYPKQYYVLQDEMHLKQELEEILYEKKGFFSIKEFDFMFDNDFKTHLELIQINIHDKKREFTTHNDMNLLYIKDIVNYICNQMMDVCPQNNIKFLNTDLEKSIEVIYKCMYENIENQIRSTQGKFKLVFDLNDMDGKQQQLLSKCLKTVATPMINSGIRIDSLTSVIKKVTISDSFSNNYALMLDDLDIQSLTFIDTHGLDHIEKGVSKKRLLKDFFSEQKENREKNLSSAKQGIDAVFYLKKLDAGRPTELDYIVPLIYEVEPQVTLYCVFTGIDIFNLDSNQVRTSWEYGDVTAPKAVQYLFSSQLEQVLDRKLKFSNGKKKIVYHTLRNNIGAFCGIDASKYIILNQERVRKILISILIREKNSIDIIPNKLIKDIKGEYYDKLKFEVKQLLLMFFDKASITNWKEIPWNTARANASRVNSEQKRKKENQLGYLGAYRHRWDMIFQESYNEIFSNERYTKKLLEVFTSNREKVESVLIAMRDKFLGKNDEIYSLKANSDSHFKKLLIRLYDGEENNPFKPSSVIVGKDTDESKKYLNNVLDFRRLISKDNHLDKFAELYILRLIDSLQDDRTSSIKNVLKYGEGIQESILSAYDKVGRIFNFEEDSKEHEVVFFDIVEKLLNEDK